MENVWDFFDAKYVLSTPQSTRKDALRENFHAIGLHDFEIIDFQPAKSYEKTRKNNSNGIGGVTNQSLMSTIRHKICDETCQNIAKNMFTLAKKGYDAGCQNIIIFEDDARFSIPLRKRRLSHCIKWMAMHEWDIFYLGYCQWPKLISWFVTKHIVKLTSPMCLHGYCLSRHGMEKVLKISRLYHIYPQHVDKIYGRYRWKKYGIFPSICFQSDAPALYKKASEKLPFDINFKAIMRLMEYGSLTIPFILSIIILILVIHMFFKTDLKKH